MVDERNRLTGAQRYKLTRWLEENLARFTEKRVSSADAATEATNTLGFTVTQRNVLSLAGSSKEAILTHSWPAGAEFGSEGGTNHMPRRLAVVVGVLDAVVRKTGTNLGELAPIFDELITEANLPARAPMQT